MLKDDGMIETNSTLAADDSFTSSTVSCDEDVAVVGTVFADEAGTLKIQFDDGSGNWDAEETREYTANEKLGFKVSVVAPYFRVIYDNGATAQGTLRLKAWEMV